MNPSIISILLHVGKIIQAVKDVESTVADLVAGKSVAADLQKDLGDILGLFQSGLIQIPGISLEQVEAAFGELSKVSG